MKGSEDLLGAHRDRFLDLFKPLRDDEKRRVKGANIPRRTGNHDRMAASVHLTAT